MKSRRLKPLQIRAKKIRGLMADIQPTLHSVLSHSTVLFLLALVLGGFEKEAIAQEPAINRSTTTRTDADNENVVNLLREAAQLIQTGRVAEAEVILRRALAAAPRNADAHNLLGIVLDQRGLAEEAEREYRTVLRLNPKAISALANLGVLLAHTKRPVEAIETLESVLRLVPGHPQATINLGLLYASQGEYKRAEDFLARANTLQPQTFDILYQLGVSLYYLKRFDEAGNALEAASALSTTDAEPFYFLGLIASARGQDEVAGELWEKAITLRPNYAEPNFMLGELLSKRNLLGAAKDHYERALQLDPSQPAHHIRLGVTQLLLGNFIQSLQILQSAAERFPKIAELHYFAAIAARGLGDYELALSELAKSLSLQPNSADGLALSGAINLDRGNFAEAEKLFRRALEVNQEHFNATYDLGRLLIKTQRYAEALPLLQRAAELHPNSPEVHYQFFLAFSRLKRKTEADHELEIYKQLLEKERMQKANR